MSAPEEAHGSYFDQAASTWDDDPRRLARAELVATAIRARIPISSDWAAIEIGAGTGLLSRCLAADLGPILLVDSSHGMTQVTAQRLARAGDTQQRVRCLDLARDRLDPAEGRFQIAYSLLAFHHVTDVGGLLQAIVDLLEPHGWVAVCDLAAEDGSFHGPDCGEPVHHGFSDDQLIDAAVAAGLEQVAVETIAAIDRRGPDGTVRNYPLLLLTGRSPG